MTTASELNVHSFDMIDVEGVALAFIEADDLGTRTLYYRVHDVKTSDSGWSAPVAVPLPYELRANGQSLITVGDPGLGGKKNVRRPGVWQVLTQGQTIVLLRALELETRWQILGTRYRLLPAPEATGPDAPRMQLVLEPEARYEHSGVREVPKDDTDRPGFRRPDGTAFIEPAIALPGIEPHGGYFNVVLTPSSEPYAERWVFFTHNNAAIPELVVQSFPRGAQGWPAAVGDNAAVQDDHILLAEDKGQHTRVELAPTGRPSSRIVRQQERSGDGSSGVTGPRVILATRARPKGASADVLLTVDFDIAADGQLVVVTDSGTLPLATVGAARSSLAFAAATDVIEIPAAVPQLASAFTAEAWISRTGGGEVILERQAAASATAPPLRISWLADTGEIVAECSFALHGGGEFAARAVAAAPSSGVWHHVAVTWDTDQNGNGGTLKIFVDATLAASKQFAASAAITLPPQGALTVGGDAKHANGYRGNVTELRLWRVARNEAQIKALLYLPLPKSDWSASELAGYWPISSPQSNLATVTDESSHKIDGIAKGADWVTNTPPIGAVDTGYGLSTGMGVLGFVTAGADPTMLASADGMIHLYAVGTGASPDSLTVAHYSTDTNRAEYALKWASSVGTETGLLTLAAHQAGPDMNRGASADLTADGTGFVKLDFTSPAKIGLTETYAGVPADAFGFAQVVNGIATDDPLAAEVRSGKKIYYDYSGTRSTIRLATDSEPLLLASARNANAPSALALDSATVGVALGDALTIETKIPQIVVNGAQVVRAFNPRIRIPGVGTDAAVAVRALRGVSTAQGAPTIDQSALFALSTARSPILFLTAAGDSLTVTLTVGMRAETLIVDIQVSGTSGTVAATFPDVPSYSAEFVAILSGLADSYKYTQAQAVVLAKFVAIGTNNAPVLTDAMLTAVGTNPIPSLQSFLNIVDNGTGSTLVPGTTTAGPAQGVLRNGAIPPANAFGSQLFQATSVPAPLNGGNAVLAPGKGALTQPGNFGGWIPAPPVTAGDFKDAVAHRGSAPVTAPLGDVGDATVEAWVMPRSAGAGRQRVLSARGRDDYGLCLGFDIGDAYAAELPSTGALTAAQLHCPIASGPNLSMWWHPSPGLADGAPILSFEMEATPARLPCELTLIRQGTTLKVDTTFGLTHDVPNIALVDAWYYLACSWNCDTLTMTVSMLKLGDSVPTTGTVQLPVLPIAFLALTPVIAFVVGTPMLLKPPGIASPGTFAQLAQWAYPVTESDMLRLSSNVPSLKEPNLQGYFELSDLVNRAVSNLALYPRGTGDLAFKQGDAPNLRQPGPFKTRRPFAAQGKRLLLGTTSLPADTWTHLAAVVSDTNAVSFSGTGTIVARTEKLQFDDAMGIDGWLLLTTAPKSKQVLIAKSDAKTDAFSYELSLDAAGRLNFIVAIDNGEDSGELLSFKSSEAVKPGVPTWFGASCEVDEDSAPPTGDFSLTTSAPNQNQQTGSVTSTTTYRVKLRGRVALYEQGAGTISIDPPSDPVVYSGKKARDVVLSETDAKVVIGAAANGTAATEFGFAGIMAELRVWSVYIGHRFDLLARSDAMPDDLSSGLEVNWTFQEGQGRTISDAVAGYNATLPAGAAWQKAAATSRLQLFIDGTRISGSFIAAEPADTLYGRTNHVTLGAVPDGLGGYTDRMNAVADEIRVWSRARTSAEIAGARYAEVNASAPDLAAYWPIATGNGETVRDVTGNGYDLTIAQLGQNAFWWQPGSEPQSPVGIEAPQFTNAVAGPKTQFQVHDAASSAATFEYGTVIAGSDGRPRGFMRRHSAYLRKRPNKTGEMVLIEPFPVGELDLDYIGQAQTDPTLIGYIEGAPPVPSENLTTPYWVGPNRYQAYDGVTSVTLSDGTEVTYNYEVGRDHGVDSQIEAGAGYKMAGSLNMEAAPIGFGLEMSGGEFEFNAGLGLEFEKTSGLLRNRSTEAALVDGVTHEMAAGGDWEPKAPGKERRYRPDNVGYALVRSSVANVFAMRLPRTGALVGISIVPETKVAPDENVIMFPMNPRYTKQGTLDGYVGFERDPDWLTGKPGEASYYRPQEATDIERQIEAHEAQIEALYQSAKVGVAYSDDVPEPGDAQTEAVDDSSSALPLDANFSGNLVNSYVWTADGGIYKESTQTMVQRGESDGGSLSWKVLGGAEVGFSMATPAGGGYFNVKAFTGGHVQTTITKSRKSAETISLDVQNECESFLVRWNHQGTEPESSDAEPGKVTAYRFKTFYLKPAEESFDKFYDDVVDRNWLGTSDDPDAIVLRSAYARRNKLWRVLHRVTYVARVPMTRYGAPAADVPAARMPVIDTDQNRVLIDAVSQDLPNHTGPLRAKVAAALDGYLSTEAAGRLPWWGWVKAEYPTEAAAVRMRAIAYLTAFFEARS